MTLLIACILDGNDEILPIAWGLVEIEDGDNWTWFLENMKRDFWGIEEPDMVFMSDRDKGLKQALSTVFPDGHSACCCQHLADNVQKEFGLACGQLFWSTAYAMTKDKFDIALEKIGEQKATAKQYLKKIPAEQWATYAFPKPRFGHITSNIVESINSSWIEIRSLLALKLLTTIWATIMHTVYE
jgi:zinc finger SWIM domain-containing protein 3